MKVYVLLWQNSSAGSFQTPEFIREYFRYELDALNRQKELENIGKMLKIDGWFSVQLGEILVKE